MPCPTCDHTMQNMGLQSERAWWCPRCGTVKTEHAAGHEFISKPLLPDRVEEAQRQMVRTSVDGRSLCAAVPLAFWRNICEAVGIDIGEKTNGYRLDGH